MRTLKMFSDLCERLTPPCCRSFEVYPDPVMQEVTHFCLPILKNTVQFVHEVRTYSGTILFGCTQVCSSTGLDTCSMYV